MSKRDEIEVWTPPPFSGTDMLPTQAERCAVTPKGVSYIEEDDLEPDDIRLPTFRVLQGQSKEVQDGVEGASPGKIFFSGSGAVLAPPIRLIMIHRFRGNAMFPDPAKHPSLEVCVSRDGVTGTRYGECEACKRCTEWGPNGEPPVGSKTQQLVLWSSEGVGIMRVSYSNRHAARAMRDLITRKSTLRRNWFTHPMVISTHRRENPDGKPYHTPELRWVESEIVPDEVQRAAQEWYRRVTQAHEHGALSDDSEEASERGASERDAPEPRTPGDEIPF